jgi:NTE family protein
VRTVFRALLIFSITRIAYQATMMNTGADLHSSHLGWAKQVNIAAVALTLSVAGCASSLVNGPKNKPLAAADAIAVSSPLPPKDVGGETMVALSFSGGGLRAAAFSFGVLQGLGGHPSKDGKTLLDEVAFITSVSGGSITAAYFGLHGVKGLDQFREAGLLRDGEAALRMSLLNPVNIARLLAGGLNDRSNFQTWLEDDLFKGATFADMYRNRKPVIWINATNAYHRIAFPFHERAFDAICSDLASFPVSEAVAASMAVPVVFAPVILQKFPGNCRSDMEQMLANRRFGDSNDNYRLRTALLRALRDFRNPDTGHYIKLIDGGITDNLGLVSILQSRILLGTPYGPISENDAIGVRKLLFVVVDAGQGPSGEWNRDLVGPSGIDIASAAVDAAIDSTMRMSFDGFVPMTKSWQEEIIRFRCGLPSERQSAIKASNPRWRCDDVAFTVTQISFADLGDREEASLSAIPTRLKLPVDKIDQLIAAGTKAVRANTVIGKFAAY